MYIRGFTACNFTGIKVHRHKVRKFVTFYRKFVCAKKIDSRAKFSTEFALKIGLR